MKPFVWLVLVQLAFAVAHASDALPLVVYFLQGIFSFAGLTIIGILRFWPFQHTGRVPLQIKPVTAILLSAALAIDPANEMLRGEDAFVWLEGHYRLVALLPTS